MTTLYQGQGNQLINQIIHDRNSCNYRAIEKTSDFDLIIRNPVMGELYDNELM